MRRAPCPRGSWCPPAIAETLDASHLQRLGKAADQARDNAHHIPQQGVVGRMMNAAGADKPGAEALSGLARAFFYAGARPLLVSHWSVDSEAASAWRRRIRWRAKGTNS
jgi:hypothetical protein